MAYLRRAALGALADVGFPGLGEDPDNPVVITGQRATRPLRLTTCKEQANRVLSAARALVEHGFAHLKNRRILTTLRTAPTKHEYGHALPRQTTRPARSR